MTKTVHAIYEGGVLRPQEPLPIEERARVRLTIQTLEDLTPERRRSRPAPPGAGAFDSGHTDTAEQAELLLGELSFGEDREP